MIPRLIVFAKAPIMGRAKTRLAAGIGPVHAQRIYRSMMTQVIRRVQDPRWITELGITPATMLGQVPEWRGLPQYSQVDGSLTPRLLQAYARTRGPVIVIGTDCPEVEANDIAQGFSALRRQDAVFGPADDGGFWLMGMRAPINPNVFDGVRWSSEHTLADVEANIAGSVAYLRTLTDVDDVEALRKVRTNYPGLI